MFRLIFICHGNICRSPMAEVIFRHLLEEKGLTGRFEVDSAAVSDEELGNGIYPPARRELLRHGLNPGDHRAWQLSEEDYRRYDLFLVMDESNRYLLRRTFKGDPEGRIRLIRSYSAHPGEVDDPWYTGRFGDVFDQLDESCRGLLDTLLKEGC